jgi:hypothetical protein
MLFMAVSALVSARVATPCSLDRVSTRESGVVATMALITACVLLAVKPVTPRAARSAPVRAGVPLV